MSITNPLIQKMPPNVDGRDYVIGDIHGCFDELIKLLKHIKFDKEKDRLFSTGDLIHRGPKSEDCLKLLFDRNTKGEKWFFPVLGNHEDIDFQLNYGDDDIILEKYENELSKLPLIYEVEHKIFGNFYIVHAELNYNTITETPVEVNDTELLNLLLTNDYTKKVNEYLTSDLQLGENDRQSLIWSRKVFTNYIKKYRNEIQNGNFDFLKTNVLQNLKIFCGHNVVPFPIKIGQQYYIDTGACFGYQNIEKVKTFSKWGSKFFSLTIVNIDTGKYYCCITSDLNNNDAQLEVEKLNLDYDKINFKELKRGSIVKYNKELYEGISEF